MLAIRNTTADLSYVTDTIAGHIDTAYRGFRDSSAKTNCAKTQTCETPKAIMEVEKQHLHCMANTYEVDVCTTTRYLHWKEYANMISH